MSMHPAYEKRLHQLLQSCTHEGTLQADDSLIIVEATHQGVTLMVAVDASTHLIQQAAYHGVLTPIQRGLLEGLAQLLIARPIQEGADHAVLRLEHQLRDRAMAPPVPGIVTSENADSAFVLPQRLIRDILVEYRRRMRYWETKNFYDEPVATTWRALTNEQRTAQLQVTINQHPDGTGVGVVGLESPQRIVVRFDESLGDTTKQRRLLALEAHLKDVIDPTLQIYLQPKTDENKPRLTKGVRL